MQIVVQMKTTVRAILDERRPLSDGTYPVKLRVINNRKNKLYSIDIGLLKKDFDKLFSDSKLKSERIKIGNYIQKIEKIIELLDDNFSFTEFEKRFFNPVQTVAKSNLNIIDQINNYILKLEKDDRIKSEQSYITTANHLKDFVKSDNISFVGVTPEFLEEVEKHLSNTKELAASSIGIYMRNIRRIFNIAIAEKIITSDVYPFGRNKYSPPATRKAKKALNIEDIKKLYEYEPINAQEQWAKDMWFFSYSANGMNVKDIAFLKYENIKDDEINFVREKTKHSTRDNQRIIQIILNYELKRIIAKWGNKKHLPKNYIFNILKEPDNPQQVYSDVHQAVKTINKYMKRIAINQQLSRIPTTNFARHSFSTVLKRAGVSIEMISEQLGHSSIKTTQIYLDSFEKEQRKEIGKHLFAFKAKE